MGFLRDVVERFSGIRRLSKFNPIVLVVTLVVGAGVWIAEELLYRVIGEALPGPIWISIVFVLLYFVLALVVFACSKVCGAFERNLLTWVRNDYKGVFLWLAIGLVAVACLSMLFEFIYEQDISIKSREPTSFIFVIDDSGSMQENDPRGERYAAIPVVLKGMDESFPFMVYGFSNDSEILRKMAPISEGVPQLSGNSTGGTAIRGVLSRVITDYQNGVWDGGDNPRVVFLTDGRAGDFVLYIQIRSIVNQYKAAGVSISTVGLGHKVNESLLQRLAQKTGGVYINVDRADELTGAMERATLSHISRTLLSVRSGIRLNALYAVMRIIFLAILGSGIGLLMSIAYGNQDSWMPNNIAAVLTSLIGAVFMEFGTAVGVPEWICWLVLWLLIAATIGMVDRWVEDVDNTDRGNRVVEDSSQHYGSKSLSIDT